MNQVHLTGQAEALKAQRTAIKIRKLFRNVPYVLQTPSPHWGEGWGEGKIF